TASAGSTRNGDRRKVSVAGAADMTSVPILIGGAAGATGSVATKLLLQMGFPVRAIVRGDDERAQSLRALGAEVFVADLLRSLVEALLSSLQAQAAALTTLVSLLGEQARDRRRQQAERLLEQMRLIDQADGR